MVILFCAMIHRNQGEVTAISASREKESANGEKKG
jgi:hypothetical protein